MLYKLREPLAELKALRETNKDLDKGLNEREKSSQSSGMRVEWLEAQLADKEELMKSLKSRGFVRETFNWQYFYWYLENEGVEYLREYLHLPAEIVPNSAQIKLSRPVSYTHLTLPTKA